MDRTRSITFTCAGAALAALVALAPAQTGGALRIDGAVIAGGGATLDGGTYQLSGTVAQPATRVLAGSTLRVYDGFWSPARAASDVIFANGFDP